VRPCFKSKPTLRRVGHASCCKLLLLAVLCIVSVTIGGCVHFPPEDIPFADIPGVYEADFGDAESDILVLRSDSIYVHIYQSRDQVRHVDSGGYSFHRDGHVLAMLGFKIRHTRVVSDPSTTLEPPFDSAFDSLLVATWPENRCYVSRAKGIVDTTPADLPLRLVRYNTQNKYLQRIEYCTGKHQNYVRADSTKEESILTMLQERGIPARR